MTRLGKHKLTNFLLILCLIWATACSKKKDTVTARLYHNTTSYFNGYYNAQQLYKETINKLEEQYRFPEQGFMEVVHYGSEDEIKSYDTDFEEIIKKNDAVMFKHPNGNYIDNCRLLNGKAWLYRQNFTLALQNFNYVLETFPESKDIAETWFRIAETHYRMENPEMTYSILQEKILFNDTLEIPEDLQGEFSLFRVRLHLDKEEYREAQSLLEKNLDFIDGRLRKARAHFLLGQLYAHNKNFAKALQQFTEVSKFPDDYELAFLAKIKIARLYVDFQKGQDDDEEVTRYLTKLLKDEKNEEYRDRIYFEFALLSLKKGDRDLAIEYLTESVRANRSNQRQKALSYFKIGQIYFYDLQNYTQAQTYYDSAATAINPDAPEYKEITTLAGTLKDYITYKHVIHYQDSMLYLAELPKAELDTLVARLVAEEERLKKEALDAQLALMENNRNNDPFFNPQLQAQQQNRNRNNANAAGPWYFDNPAAISNGRIQFEQLWGQRSNQDHWRRSNQSSSFATVSTNGQGIGGEDPANAAPVDSSLLQAYGENYKYYKDIPRDEDEKKAAHLKIEEAMYKLGQLYGQKLEEPDSAIQTFESLLDRYDDSEYTLQTRYALYQLYQERKNPIARVHKNYILSEHPNTVYAYLIQGRDPNELKKDEEDFAFAYTGLFNSYLQEQYETSIGFSEFLLAQSQFAENPEIDMAQLLYIRGMAYGHLGYQDSLTKILTHVVQTYPEAPVTPRAQETLSFLKNGIPDRPNEVNATIEESPSAGIDENDPRFKGFVKEPGPRDKIFVLMYVGKDKVSKAEATAKVSDFNKQNYPKLRLKVFTFLYQNTHLLPYISNFGTVEEARNYIQAFRQHPTAQELLPTDAEKIFYISHTNFKVAYSKKRIADYLLYYSSILKE